MGTRVVVGFAVGVVGLEVGGRVGDRVGVRVGDRVGRRVGVRVGFRVGGVESAVHGVPNDFASVDWKVPPLATELPFIRTS